MMIDLNEFVGYVENYFDLVTGVPCSYFKEFLSHLDNSERGSKIKHILATREDEAIAIATGAAFSKKRALVYMQNSGLGNIGDALTSLTALYRLPILILMSYRGLKDDEDFPEHSIMGKITTSLLDSLNLTYGYLNDKPWECSMQKALFYMDEFSFPMVLLVKKGDLC